MSVTAPDWRSLSRSASSEGRDDEAEVADAELAELVLSFLVGEAGLLAAAAAAAAWALREAACEGRVTVVDVVFFVGEGRWFALDEDAMAFL